MRQARRHRALFAAVALALTTASAEAQSNRRTVFKDLLRVYGCVHVVYLVAIASQTSSHGGLIFQREVLRVGNGSRSADFVSQENFRCGRMRFAPEATAGSIQAFTETLEAAANTIAAELVNTRWDTERARREIAAALARFGNNDLPEVSDVAQPSELAAEFGAWAGELLIEYEAALTRAMAGR